MKQTKAEACRERRREEARELEGLLHELHRVTPMADVEAMEALTGDAKRIRWWLIFAAVLGGSLGVWLTSAEAQAPAEKVLVSYHRVGVDSHGNGVYSVNDRQGKAVGCVVIDHATVQGQRLWTSLRFMTPLPLNACFQD